MIPSKHFYMIRHGETEANAAEIMAGSLDSPLTARGRDQARLARHVVAGLSVKPRVILHSNLSRARETASIINESLKVEMHEDPDFAEIHVGDWEGVAYHLIPELFDPNEWVDTHNGEPAVDFFARVRRGKKRALETHAAPALIVCHGGVFRAFGKLYNISIPPAIRNCHLYEFTPSEQARSFPWDAWHYDLDEEKALRRDPADFFRI
ncbi:MAG: histidine phosphatase family protein [Alphaproteobacteria bacterium]